MITTKQASRYWCPYARGTYIDSFRHDAGTGCLGTKCSCYHAVDTEKGYCGLAGRPPQVSQPMPATPREDIPPWDINTRPVHTGIGQKAKLATGVTDATPYPNVPNKKS